MTMFSRLWSCISFTNPEPNEVAVLLPDGYWIKKLVLKDLPSTTLELFLSTKGIYVTPALIARTFWRLRLVDWFKAETNDFFRDLGRKIYAQYVLACIDQIGAKVVLTFVDNSRFFQYLTRVDKDRTYFAIQNGTRTLVNVRDSLPPYPHLYSVISMTNFFCFGRRDIDLFCRYGHELDAYYPIGSLIGGYYKSVVSASVGDPQFDLCLISQWHQQFFDKMTSDASLARTLSSYRVAIERMNSFLFKLMAETGLSLVVCPRNDRDDAEVAFYTDMFGEKATIAESDRENFSTYRVVEKCRLAIALNSTTLLEIMSWGQKVLWCNIPNNEHYEMPEAGISYFHGDDYNAFKERVLMLLRMRQADYETATRESARYINNYDPANPPHEIIRSVVLMALTKSDN